MTKIPVGATIAHAYRFAFGNALAVLKAIWMPLLAQLAVISLAAKQMLPILVATQSHDPSVAGLIGPLLLTFPFLMIFFSAEFAAATQLALGRPRSWLDLPFGKRTWFLLGGFLAATGAIIAVALAAILAAWLLTFVLGILLKTMPGVRLAVAILLVAIFFCGLIFIAMRFLFLLAPVNISEQRLGVQRAWELSAGNFWRIFLITLAIAAPVGVINYAYGIALAGWPPILVGAGQDAQRAAETAWRIRQMTAMIDRWYLTLPLGALMTLFQFGAGCSAQVFAYRVRTADAAPSL